MTIAEASRRVNSMLDGLENEIINHIVPQVEDDIVGLQQKRMYKGLLSNEEPILPEYENYTVIMKLYFNQPTDRVTLKDTGNFYKNIFAETWDGKEVIIDSRDNKSGELKEKYGENIFGLTKDDPKEIIPKTNDLLVEYIKRITGFG